MKGVLKMIEKNYSFTITDEKIIERIVDDENINLNHMVLRNGESLPEHFSNSNVYMIITKGVLSIKLDNQDFHNYRKGEILNIPYNIKMDVTNQSEEVLEFFVVKSPNPKDYKKD